MRIGGDKEVAALLGISPARLKMRISAGSPVPPYMRAPGSKFRRWDLDAAEAWLAGFTVESAPAPSSAPPGSAAVSRRRGPGRPTKRESLR
jgi:hypothetical protein